jgi:hypothetical protein
MASRLRSALPTVSGIFGLCCACSAPSARLHAGYMQSGLSGNASLQTTVAGTSASARANVESGLGLADDSNSLYVRAELDAGPLRFSGSAFRYEQSGRGRLDVDFGDIRAGTEVDADISMGVLKGGLTFDLLDLGVIRISPGLGADLIDLEATVVDASGLTNESERIDELVPIPILFVQAEAEIGPVSAVVEFGGMDITYDTFSGRLVDLEALLLVEPVDSVELFAGYRWISLDASGQTDDGDFATDLVLQGWFAGGGFRF